MVSLKKIVALLFLCIAGYTLSRFMNAEEKNVLSHEDSNVCKKVVITGATKGLGRALAKEFIHKGWQVAGCGLSTAAVDELKKEYGDKHHFAVVDVTNADAVNAWAREVENAIGTPDMLINGAAIIHNLANVWEIPSLEFENVMKVNVNGTFNVLKAFLPFMIEKKQGIIINISSDGGRMGEAQWGPYCASKFAIEGLTQSLAQELPEGMAAVTLDPGGGINTDMLKQCLPDTADQYPSPEKWAQSAIKFICTISIEDNGKALTVPKLN